MHNTIHMEILPQPDDITCGPTCLHAVYNYYEDERNLMQVIQEVPKLADGGTLAVLLGLHALENGYDATLYTYDVKVFDPTWFRPSLNIDLSAKLREQIQHKSGKKIRFASEAYLRFLGLGGRITFEDLKPSLIRRLLKHDTPILTGLCSTYLYRTAREIEQGNRMIYDDIRGVPVGHFVVLCGYNMEAKTARVADPLMPNPVSDEQIYEVELNHLICSIMLGILTFDANLLVITPSRQRRGRH